MNGVGLKDIHGPVSVPGDWWWLWVVLALFLIGGATVVWMLFLRKSFCSEVKPVAVPPWEKALLALLELEKQTPHNSDEVKQYYFILSGIIRLYIEERFNIRAPEMTTEEFMDRSRASSDLLPQHRVFLDDFLNVSDMVKFARFEPRGQDLVEVMRSARIFVEGTRPLPETAAPDNVRDKPV